MGKPLVRSLRYVAYRTGGRVLLLHLCGNQSLCVCIALPHTAHSLCSHCRERVGTLSSSFINLLMQPGQSHPVSHKPFSCRVVTCNSLYCSSTFQKRHFSLCFVLQKKGGIRPPFLGGRGFFFKKRDPSFLLSLIFMQKR